MALFIIEPNRIHPQINGEERCLNQTIRKKETTLWDAINIIKKKKQQQKINSIRLFFLYIYFLSNILPH